MTDLIQPDEPIVVPLAPADVPLFEGVSVEELAVLEDDGYSDEDVLELAQALLIAAVPLLATHYSVLSSRDRKIVKYAVLEMAEFLKIDFNNFSKATSPFQSESIGSYVYSKSVNRIKDGDPTGVPAFDRAVAYLLNLFGLMFPSTSIEFSSNTEQVFKQGYDQFHANRTGLNAEQKFRYPTQYYNQDPSYDPTVGTNNWFWG